MLFIGKVALYMKYVFRPAEEYPVLTLAYIGDAVFELYVRNYLVEKDNIPVSKLHKEATGYVKATAQSSYIDKIYDLLNEEEQNVYKRGRNAHPKTAAKNADILSYRRATGFEALVGWLYINGNITRLDEIISEIFETKNI